MAILASLRMEIVFLKVLSSVKWYSLSVLLTNLSYDINGSVAHGLRLRSQCFVHLICATQLVSKPVIQTSTLFKSERIAMMCVRVRSWTADLGPLSSVCAYAYPRLNRMSQCGHAGIWPRWGYTWATVSTPPQSSRGFLSGWFGPVVFVMRWGQRQPPLKYQRRLRKCVCVRKRRIDYRLA